jgi:cation:H+ antiporter
LLINRDFPVMVVTTLACLPIFWSGGVISRAEGWVLLGLYGLFLAEQIMHTAAFTGLDQFRFVVLAAVVPLVLVFVVWNAMDWRQGRLRSN